MTTLHSLHNLDDDHDHANDGHQNAEHGHDDPWDVLHAEQAVVLELHDAGRREDVG